MGITLDIKVKNNHYIEMLNCHSNTIYQRAKHDTNENKLWFDQTIFNIFITTKMVMATLDLISTYAKSTLMSQ